MVDSFQRWNKEILQIPALVEIIHRQRQQQAKKRQYWYPVLLKDVCSLAPLKKMAMAFVTIAITRRATTNSKVHQQPVELMNNRFQTTWGTSTLL